jgi:hypothetical protein
MSTKAGRPAGTVRTAGRPAARKFPALIESLYRADDQSSVPQTAPMKGTDND